MKKLYKKPSLQKLGKMKHLTKGAASGVNDPGGNLGGKTTKPSKKW